MQCFIHAHVKKYMRENKKLTFSICKTHICDTAEIGYLRVCHCKTQDANITIIGTATPAPADAGLNPDNKV